LVYKNPLSAYKEAKVTTAGQGQLIVMLYNETVKYLDEALQLLEGDDTLKKEPGGIERFGKAIVKAQEIITELMVSLDFEKGGDIAHNLFSLYTWFNRELLEANINKDAHRIINVKNFIYELRGAWMSVVSSGASDAASREHVGVSIAG
jgi:flagellar protein FliS